MNHHLPFIEQKDPVNTDELKENFRKHDFTALTASCELNPQTKEEQYFQARALDAFRPIWLALQKAMGGRTEEKNFSKDDPIFMLKHANENYVAGMTAAICMEQTALSRVFDIFDNMYGDKFQCVAELYAVVIGKEFEAWDENDLMQAFQVFVNMFLESQIKLLMKAQSVPEMIGVVNKHRAHEDFEPHTYANYDKINFNRRWNHLRTKIGALLSLETFQVDECEALGFEEEFDFDVDIDPPKLKMLIKAFLQTRDQIDRKIYRMREKGMTQEEIADALGYETHSAVTKRLKNMKTKLTEYLNKHKKIS